MKYKYKIQAVFDPCSYPGIQSKLFFDDNGVYSESTTEDNLKRKNISFMIFRTGSILIVGKCEEINLYKVYDYLKELLHNEYNEIKNVLEIFDLPTKLPKNINIEKLFKTMLLDKKVKNNEMVYILPSGIGNAYITNKITKKMVIKALKEHAE